MTLDDLYAEYKTRENTGRRAFNNLFKRFQEGRNTTFIEAVACSASVMALHIDAGFDPSDLTPELQESFRLAFPNLNIENVGNYSGEQLEGLLQPWKGKLFEVSVRDRLNKALFAKSVVKHDFRWPRPATERVSVQQLIHGPSSETIPDNLRDSV